MVIKPDVNDTDYSETKNTGETLSILGIPTQCVVATHPENPTELYIRNVLFNMNVKLGGVNWSITWDDITPWTKRFFSEGNKNIHGGVSSWGFGGSI